MEKTFRKTPEDAYPQKIFAHQLITIDDLQQFQKTIIRRASFSTEKANRSCNKKVAKVS